MTSTDRKARAQQYRDAARHLELGDTGCFVQSCRASCCVLRNTACDDEVVVYREYFMHDGHHEQNGWWNIGIHSDENSGARILALCLMAAMVEAGDA